MSLKLDTFTMTVLLMAVYCGAVLGQAPLASTLKVELRTVSTLLAGYFGTTKVHFVADSTAFADGVHTHTFEDSRDLSSGLEFMLVFTTTIRCAMGNNWVQRSPGSNFGITLVRSTAAQRLQRREK